MTDSIIVALISGGLALAGTVMSNMLAHSKTMYRIQQLEAKVEKHNNLVERMYICEGQIKVIEQAQKDDEKDIDELKARLAKS